MKNNKMNPDDIPEMREGASNKQPLRSIKASAEKDGLPEELTDALIEAVTPKLTLKEMIRLTF